MRKLIQVVVFTTLLFGLADGIAQAQWCDPNQLRTAEDLERNYRVIDARPGEVNKVRGKNAFKKRAQLAIINMNPFMYTYDVKVEQSLIEDRAQLDFLKLLGGPITDLAGIAPFRAVATSQDAEELQAGGLGTPGSSDWWTACRSTQSFACTPTCQHLFGCQHGGRQSGFGLSI